MSFKQIYYDKVLQEEWDDSAWCQVLESRFLLMVFDENSESLEKTFKGACFWTLSDLQMDEGKLFWEELRALISKNDFDGVNQLKSESSFHVRPKAKNAEDRKITLSGMEVRKNAYWIYSSVIVEVLKKHNLIL